MSRESNFDTFWHFLTAMFIHKIQYFPLSMLKFFLILYLFIVSLWKNRCFSRLYLTCPERVKSFIISQHITQKASRTVQISSWEIIFVTARALTMILQIFFDIWRWWAINFPDGQKYIFGMPVWSVIEELSLELE